MPQLRLRTQCPGGQAKKPGAGLPAVIASPRTATPGRQGLCFSACPASLSAPHPGRRRRSSSRTASIPPIWEVISPQLSIVRFHGRNRETWQNKGITAAERFNYLYRDAELRVFAEPICSLEGQADELHLMFNNCHRDDAQRNALQLQSILQGG